MLRDPFIKLTNQTFTQMSSVCKSQRFFEQTVVEFGYSQPDTKARKQEQKNPAFENNAIRSAIWELIELESVHFTSNRKTSNVILQSRAHNQESGTKFEKSLPFTNCHERIFEKTAKQSGFIPRTITPKIMRTTLKVADYRKGKSDQMEPSV